MSHDAPIKLEPECGWWTRNKKGLCVHCRTITSGATDQGDAVCYRCWHNVSSENHAFCGLNIDEQKSAEPEVKNGQ